MRSSVLCYFTDTIRVTEVITLVLREDNMYFILCLGIRKRCDFNPYPSKN